MRAMTREERDRYEVLRAKLEAAVVSVEELENGYRIRLNGALASTDEIAEWVEFEKKCCPFFRLEMTGSGEAPELQVTGRDGVKAFIRAEFSAIRFE
jgi:hypothetical protein